MSELSRDMGVTDINRYSRRAVISGAIWAQADHQPHWVQTDDERLMLLMERIGDVAAAHTRAHTDLLGELQQAAGTLAAWMEKIEEASAL